MKKQSFRVSTVMTPVMIICSLLAPASSARAASEEGACSNRTIQGQYGGTLEGLFFAAPGVTLPISGVDIINYDGQGNLNEYGGYLVLNGTPPATTGATDSGTYQVNAACTGTAHILVDPSTNFFINLAFVVVRDGKEIHAVITGPYAGPTIMTSYVLKRIS
jgi:hypothetical protein